METLNLSFYTNIPTPYQDDFFKALSKICNFKAVYYSKTESDRQWKLELRNYNFEFLRSTWLANAIQLFFKDFHFSLDIYKLCKNESSDWIILGGNYFALNNLLAIFFLKSRGKKLAFFSERIKTSNLVLNYLKKIYLKIFLSKIDLMIYVGNTAKQSYESFGFYKKFLIIPYNINIKAFEKGNLDPLKIKNLSEELHLDGRKVMLTSGSLIHRKGIDLAIECCNRISDTTHPDIALIIMGSGQLENQLMQKVKCEVRFVGFIPKDYVPYYYAISDIFLFCSRYDGWGLVINEAIAAELPIICSKAVGASEWIKEGENGYLVSDNELSQYQKNVEILLNDSETRIAFGKFNSRFKKDTSSDYYANYLVRELNSWRL